MASFEKSNVPSKNTCRKLKKKKITEKIWLLKMLTHIYIYISSKSGKHYLFMNFNTFSKYVLLLSF